MTPIMSNKKDFLLLQKSWSETRIQENALRYCNQKQAFSNIYFYPYTRQKKAYLLLVDLCCNQKQSFLNNYFIPLH